MSDHPSRRGELFQVAGDGGAVYVAQTDSLHVLNATARAIWELCDGRTSASEMAMAISEVTGMDVEQARIEVDTALVDLERLRLIR
jgi:hypothetical protein